MIRPEIFFIIFGKLEFHQPNLSHFFKTKKHQPPNFQCYTGEVQHFPQRASYKFSAPTCIFCSDEPPIHVIILNYASWHTTVRFKFFCFFLLCNNLPRHSETVINGRLNYQNLFVSALLCFKARHKRFLFSGKHWAGKNSNETGFFVHLLSLLLKKSSIIYTFFTKIKQPRHSVQHFISIAPHNLFACCGVYFSEIYPDDNVSGPRPEFRPKRRRSVGADFIKARYLRRLLRCLDYN